MNTELQKTLNEELQNKELVLSKIKTYEISNQENYEFAGEQLKQIKSNYKKLEEKEKSATAPINESLKEIRSWFKPVKEFYESCEVIWKQKIKTYGEIQIKKQQEADRKLREEKEKQKEQQRQPEQRTFMTALVETQKINELKKEASIETKPQGVTFREDWKFEIINASEIPREFLIPDEKLIRQHVIKNKDKTSIKGIRVFSEKTVVSARG